MARRWLSLRARTLVVASIGITALLLTDSVISIRSAARSGQAALQERADLLATTQALALGVPLWDFDRAQTDAILGAIASDPDFQAVRIRDAGGSLSEERRAPGQPSSDALRARREIEHRDGSDRRVLGTLDLELSTARLAAASRGEVIYQLLSQFVLLASVLVAVSAALRHLARPLDMIAQVTARLAGGDHAVAVPELDRTDEVGAVARAIQVFKENAVALARAEEKYRAIYENAALGIGRSSPDGRVMEANPALVRIAGYDDEPALLAALSVPGGLAARWYAEPDRWDALARLLETQDIVSGFVSEIVRPDGSLAWISETVRAMRDDSGRLLFLESTVEDVTERKRLAEDERLRVRAAVESASDAMAIVDAGGIPVYVNPAFRSLLGHGLGELRVLGGPAVLLHDDAVRRSVLTALRNRDGWAGEADVTTRDGRLISVALRASPIAGADGSAAGSAFILTDVRERKRADEYIRHMALHDALTDLPNRTLLRGRLELGIVQRRRHGGVVGVLCVDLDRFKVVNDTLGHAAGDGLLKIVADRLRASVRQGDTVARLGGDEFVIVQADAADIESVDALCRRLLAALCVPFRIDGQEITIGASIGAAVCPVDGDDADLLLRRSDLALYRGKTEGRGIHRLFEPQMEARLQARLGLERDLRKAVAGEELILHYQPQIDVLDRRITGAEALLRWPHPERGMISPAEFVPLAEEAGLIVPLGEWVIRTACREAASWPEPMRVAVNLSPLQFRQADLAQSIGQILAETGLAASRLELEITEGVLLRETDATLATLRELKRLGVRIAMDDFGTGYSSLNYLRCFPFDKIKIDQSFVRDLGCGLEATAIVRAIIVLGTSLGMHLIAEGVETAEQAEFLQREGCREMQGYFFGRPASIERFRAMLASWSGRSSGFPAAASSPDRKIA